MFVSHVPYRITHVVVASIARPFAYYEQWTFTWTSISIRQHINAIRMLSPFRRCNTGKERKRERQSNEKCRLSKEERPIQVRTLRTKVTCHTFFFARKLNGIVLQSLNKKEREREFFPDELGLSVSVSVSVPWHSLYPSIYANAMPNVYADFCFITSHPLSGFNCFVLILIKCGVAGKKKCHSRCCAIQCCQHWLINKRANENQKKKINK